MLAKARIYELHGTLHVPLWKIFICSPQNKENLLSYWHKTKIRNQHNIPHNCSLICDGIKLGPAVIIYHEDNKELSDLSCPQHKEADVWIFVHVIYSVRKKRYRWIVVQATDTDIIIMGICFTNKIQNLHELWIQKGNSFIPCHIITSNLVDIYTENVSGTL